MMSGRTRAGAIIVLIVVCSALAGAAIDRVVTPRMHHGGGGPGGSRMSAEQQAEHRKEMLDDMTKQLSLTESQRAGVATIMLHTDSTLRAIRHEMQPKIKAELDSSHALIVALLDSAQREKFAKIPRRSPPAAPRR